MKCDGKLGVLHIINIAVVRLHYSVWTKVNPLWPEIHHPLSSSYDHRQTSLCLSPHTRCLILYSAAWRRCVRWLPASHLTHTLSCTVLTIIIQRLKKKYLSLQSSLNIWALCQDRISYLAHSLCVEACNVLVGCEEPKSVYELFWFDDVLTLVKYEWGCVCLLSCTYPLYNRHHCSCAKGGTVAWFIDVDIHACVYNISNSVWHQVSWPIWMMYLGNRSLAVWHQPMTLACHLWPLLGHQRVLVNFGISLIWCTWILWSYDT